MNRDEMRKEADWNDVKDFIDRKHELITRRDFPLSEREFDILIIDAEALGLISSKAQLESYRDHYYPKEQK